MTTPDASVPRVVPARCHDGGPVGLHVGLATVDLVQRVDRLPGPDEKVTAIRADVAAGGPAINAAVTFAALGGQAVLVTAVGAGPLAGVVRDDLAACGVRLVDVAPPGYAVPVSAAAVVEATGERSIVSRNAAGADVGVPADLAALVAGAAVVLVDGHHPALALAVARAAAAHGIPVVLDAGGWKPVLSRLLPLVTLAVCSETFAVPESFALPVSVMPPGASTDGVAALLGVGPAFVAVTAGPRPVVWWTAGAFGHVDVPAVDALDTHGAGDVLHGAFAHALACGADPVEALRRGVAVAALRVQHVGPRSWLRALPGVPPPERVSSAGGDGDAEPGQLGVGAHREQPVTVVRVRLDRAARLQVTGTHEEVAVAVRGQQQLERRARRPAPAGGWSGAGPSAAGRTSQRMSGEWRARSSWPWLSTCALRAPRRRSS